LKTAPEHAAAGKPCKNRRCGGGGVGKRKRPCLLKREGMRRRSKIGGGKDHMRKKLQNKSSLSSRKKDFGSEKRGKGRAG